MSKNRNININGPVNIVRLEGKINNINKIIYLFLDKHNEVDKQTQCDDFNAIDVQNFFALELKNIKHKMVDIFLEMGINEYHERKENILRKRYIDEVITFFVKQLNFKKVNNKLKASSSDYNFNIRYHYADTRDIGYDSFYYKCLDILKDIDDVLLIPLQENKLHLIKFIDLKNLINEFEYLIEYLLTIEYVINIKNYEEIKEKFKKNKVPSSLIVFVKMIFKLRDNYNNKTIQKFILTEFDTHYNNLLNLISDIKKIKESIENIYNTAKTVENIPKFKKDITIINTFDTNILINVLNWISHFMDIYFLRRFLDKDYITHVISYTGYYHSLFYIFTLVKYFNFKVTHVSNDKNIKSINELNKEIFMQKHFDLEQLEKYFINIKNINNKEILLQCSNFNSFPPDFN